ncbi:MAG: YjbQ family protein [Actinomycetota bacterium]|nr:YjbQ family protein [Actinomycetota bacterium]
MLTHHAECRARTAEAPGFIDLTDEIQAAIDRSPVAEGRITVFSPSDGCAILVNERETGLLQDIKAAIARLNGGRGRGHSLVGSASVVLPVSNGKLQLGQWQRVLLVELAEPTERTVSIQIVGESTG